MVTTRARLANLLPRFAVIALVLLVSIWTTAPREIASASPGGTLEVHTVPDEVNIYVADVLKGTTSSYYGEATIQELAEGTHTLRLSKGGCRDWVKQLSIAPSLTTVVYAYLEPGAGNSTTRNETISETSASLYGSLQLHTSPDEVNVYVDKEFGGTTTPYYGDATVHGLLEGKYVLRLEKSGHKDWVKQVDITRGLATSVFVYLESGVGNATTRSEVVSAASASLYGDLQLYTSPDEVEVYLTGEFGGITSTYYGEATVRGLIEGTYSLRLSKMGYKDSVKFVSINQGLATTIYSYLEAGTGNATTRNEIISAASASLYGSLELHSSPDELNIYVGAEFGGKTSQYYGEAIVKGLLEGTYSLRLSKVGYKDWLKLVSISPGLVTTVYAYLETGVGNSTTRSEVISATSLFGGLKVYTLSDVSVHVDGEFGGTTSYQGAVNVQGLAEGTFTLRLLRSGYRDWLKSVGISPGLTTVVYAYLEPGAGNSTTRNETISETSVSLYGNLKLDTSPDVVVYVGGEFGGITDYSGATVQGLIEGTYSLNLTKVGYYDWTNEVVIRSGQTTTIEAELIPFPPDVHFSANPMLVSTGEYVSFSDLSTGIIDSWLWDFGDGFTSTDQNPFHTYEDDGNYTVTLTVSNLGGSKTLSSETYVVVYTELNASFSFNPTEIEAGEEVRFLDESTGAVTSWLWDFGDGYTSTQQNATHVYDRAGTYLVRLTISNPIDSDTTSMSVMIPSSIPNEPTQPLLSALMYELIIGLILIAVAILAGGALHSEGKHVLGEAPRHRWLRLTTAIIMGEGLMLLLDYVIFVSLPWKTLVENSFAVTLGISAISYFVTGLLAGVLVKSRGAKQGAIAATVLFFINVAYSFLANPLLNLVLMAPEALLLPFFLGLLIGLLLSGLLYIAMGTMGGFIGHQIAGRGPYTGGEFAPREPGKTCPSCGLQIKVEDTFCRNCGKKFSERSATDSARVTVQEIEDLQKAADFLVVRKSRTMGIGSIVFGTINSVLGIATIRENPLNWILLLLGLSLLAEGFWICIKPSPMGFLIDGVFFFVVGLWNIVVSTYNLQQYYAALARYYSSYYYYGSYPFPSGAFFVGFGIAQFALCVMRIKRYRRFSGMSHEKPSEQLTHRVNELVESVKKAEPAGSEDLIEFQDRWSGAKYKGKLSGDVGIFVGVTGTVIKSIYEALFVRRDDVQILIKGKIRLRRKLMVKVKIGAGSISGIMSPESIQRYERMWKLPPPPPPPQ
jgi:PKD repeat protein